MPKNMDKEKNEKEIKTIVISTEVDGVTMQEDEWRIWLEGLSTQLGISSPIQLQPQPTLNTIAHAGHTVPHAWFSIFPSHQGHTALFALCVI